MTKKEKLLTKENEELLGYNANLHDDLQKANEKINLLRDSNKGLSEHVSKMDDVMLRNSDVESEIKKLRIKNEALRNESGIMINKIEELRIERDMWKNGFSTKFEQVDELKRKIEELRNQRDVWRDGFGVQSNANESLRAEGKKVNEELGKRCIELEKQVEKLTQDRLDWKGMTESMTKKYKKLLEEQGNLIMDSKKARASNVNVHPTMDCSDDNLVVLYIGDPEIYTVDSFEQAVREVTELTANGREGVIARILAKVESKPEEFTYDPYTAN